MPGAQIAQTAFNGGEISPLSIGRTDIATYRHSVLRLENFLATPTGPVERRMGTRFVAEVADSDKASRLIPFVFSNEESYILELSEFKIRVFSPSGVGGFIIPVAQIFKAVDVLDSGDTPANTIRFRFAHYFADEAGPFRLETDDTLPSGLDDSTDYFIILKTPASFQLSLTAGGSAVVLTDGGTGNHTITATGTVIQEIATPFTEAQLFELDFAQTADILYFAHQEHHPQKLERRADTSFRLVDVDFEDGPWDPINTTQITLNPADLIPEGPVHFRRFDAEDVHLTGDDLTKTIVIPEHGFVDEQGPFEIQDRNLSSTLPTGLLENTLYFVVALDKDSFQISTTAGGAAITITSRGVGPWFIGPGSNIQGTFSAEQLDDNGDNEDSRDVRRLWRYREAISLDFEPSWSWGPMMKIVDKSVIEMGAHRKYTDGANPAEVIWRLGAFWKASSGGFSNNYPRKVFFHEQRLWYASTPNDPLIIFGSQTGDFENFAPDEGLGDRTDLKRVVTAASGITYLLAAGSQNAIQWMAAVRSLLISTSNNIWPMQGSSLLEPLTPSNVSARPSASLGSSDVKPVLVGDEVVYSSRSHKKILAVGFNFERDSFVPDDLTVLASHLTTSGITQFAYTLEPHSIIWASRKDGQLIACTYDRGQRVLGWHRHFMGGSFGTGTAQVESVAAIQDFEDLYDQLWVIVKRTIEGNTKRYIEFVTKEFDLDDDIEDAHYLDSSPLAYNGAATNTLSGLDHLDGETVDVLGNGVAFKGLAVVSGTVTLPDSKTVTKAIVGLPYVSKLETLPIDAEGAPGGTLIDRNKRIVDLYFRVVRTNSLKVGRVLKDRSEKLSSVDFPAGLMDAPVPLFTGDIKIKPQRGWEKDGKVLVAQDNPTPCSLISLVGRMEWSERG